MSETERGDRPFIYVDEISEWFNDSARKLEAEETVLERIKNSLPEDLRPATDIDSILFKIGATAGERKSLNSFAAFVTSRATDLTGQFEAFLRENDQTT